jgi:DNA polymerase I
VSKHLLIVDGHAVAHRAYHSIPHLTFNGQPINAIYGFYSMILTALETLKPDYLIVCLDSPGPTFRNTEFLGYRAKRKPADRELVSQLPLLPETLSFAKIPYYAIGGYEADDLIATIVSRGLKRKKNLKITIITGDKDLMQLVDENTSLFMPLRGLSETKIIKPEDVVDKLGVLPSQVIDLKALMGDMSDNYPGVAGIGPKVAVDLLAKYQNLDNVYQHLDEIKTSVQEKLIKDKDNAYLSQKLATLIYNIPLKFSLKKSKFNDDKLLNLLGLFKSYNFKSLVSRLQKKLNVKIDQKKQDDQKNQPSLF